MELELIKKLGIERIKKNHEDKQEKNEEVTARISCENRLKSKDKDAFSLESKKEESEFFENQADHWMTTKEAAEYLRISAKSLLNLTSNGKVKFFKLGRRNRFLLNDMRKLLLGNPRGDTNGN